MNKNNTSFHRFRSRPRLVEGVIKRSLISTARSTIHTNPTRKRSFLKTSFKPEEFKNDGYEWCHDKYDKYEPGPYLSFPQTQIQND